MIGILVWRMTASATIAVVACGLISCKGGEDLAEKGAISDAAARNPMEMTVPEGLMKQIRIGEPVYEDVTGSLRVSGRVEADETRMARISAPATGRITEMDVVEGQQVKRGQVLATLYSTEMSGVQFSFVKAVSQQQLAQRSVGRAKQLLTADVIGTAELQRREAELLQASAELSSAKDQLRVLGMTDEAIQKLEQARAVNSVTNIVATIDGMITERRVTPGQIVQPAEVMMTIADLSRVWLIADVPEQSAGTVAVGKIVEAEIPALPGEKIRGKLDFVSAVVNPETRTVRTRMNLANPKGRYKPAMLATLTIKDGTVRRPVLPGRAIVREENEDYVFVQVAANKVMMTPVLLGDEHEDGRVLLDGLQPGQKVVLDGAFHLNNERKRMALQGAQ